MDKGTEISNNQKILLEHISSGSLAKEYDADKGMICRWIRGYNQYGESAFDAIIE